MQGARPVRKASVAEGTRLSASQARILAFAKTYKGQLLTHSEGMCKEDRNLYLRLGRCYRLCLALIPSRKLCVRLK